MKRILSIDFDGTLNSYSSGYQGDTIIGDPPTSGARERLQEYMRHFLVVIVSSRFNNKHTRDEAMAAMCRWLHEHRLITNEPIWRWTDWRDDILPFVGEEPCLILCATRPPSLMTIDDRGYRFQGIWPTVDEIQALRVWYKPAFHVGVTGA